MLANMGDFGQASAVAAEAVAVGETTDHPFSLTLALLCAGVSRAMRGDIAGAAIDLERGRAVCDEWNIRYISPLLTGTVGWIRALSGATEEGLALLEQSDVDNRSVGFQVIVLSLQPLLIEAQVLARRFKRAEHCASSALALVRHHQTRALEASLLRL